MTTPRRSTPPASATTMSWMLHLASRILASSLNLPEPLLHSTGMFVYARVQSAEHRAAKTLCPVAMWRRLQALVRRS